MTQQSQSGKVESAVKSAKNFSHKALDAATDPFRSILDYWNAPTQGMDPSPVKRLMNRQTCTLLPTTGALHQPRMPKSEQDIKDLAK